MGDRQALRGTKMLTKLPDRLMERYLGRHWLVEESQAKHKYLPQALANSEALIHGSYLTLSRVLETIGS